MGRSNTVRISRHLARGNWPGILGKKNRRMAPLQPQDAIRQGLQTPYADRDKMPQRPKYYAAQLTMLDSELKRYCAAVKVHARASQSPCCNQDLGGSVRPRSS